MNKKSLVRLTEEERRPLSHLGSTGKAAGYKVNHANMGGKAEGDGDGWSDEQLAHVFSAHPNTAAGVRQRFGLEGMEGALPRKKRQTPPREKLLDGEKEAHLSALRCSPPPEGQARWTLRLLAEKLLGLESVESISHETVRQT